MFTKIFFILGTKIVFSIVVWKLDSVTKQFWELQVFFVLVTFENVQFLLEVVSILNVCASFQ